MTIKRKSGILNNWNGIAVQLICFIYTYKKGDEIMKKDQVIEAARELFHQFGFKKVSMDEIAAKAGVTKKTIYMYFSSKEELLKYFIQ